MELTVEKRIGISSLLDKVMSAEEAAKLAAATVPGAKPAEGAVATPGATPAAGQVPVAGAITSKPGEAAKPAAKGKEDKKK